MRAKNFQDNEKGAALHEYMAEEHEKLVTILLERDAQIDHLTDENRCLMELKSSMETSMQTCTERLQQAVSFDHFTMSIICVPQSNAQVQIQQNSARF